MEGKATSRCFEPRQSFMGKEKTEQIDTLGEFRVRLMVTVDDRLRIL